MKKISINFVALLCAMFTFQSVSSAVTGEREQIYSQTFADGFQPFNEEVSESYGYVWQWMNVYKKVYAMSDGAFVDSRLVSPEIDLLTQNVVSLEYVAMEFADLENEFCLSVRTGGGEWTDIPLSVINVNGDVVPVEFAIPEEFNNKKVQIGLRFHASSGTILISNFVVTGIKDTSVPTEKADAGLAYNTNEAVCIIGGDFIAPVLSNPNNLTVTYSSSNEVVASIDQNGVVTILSEGVTTIKAESAETDSFKAGEASYTLSVKPAGLDAQQKEIFSETFSENLGKFNEEFTKGANKIWQWFSTYKMAYADAFGVTTDSRLISPEIKLLSKNIVRFDYLALEFSDLAKQFYLSVRKPGGAWTDLALPVIDTEGNLTTVEFNIPVEFDNSNVEFGLRYNTNTGTILISNFVVLGEEGGVIPEQKADPGIGFAVKEMKYNISSEFGFAAPEFYNPNNVNVKFESSDGTVAAISEDGSVTIIMGVGTTEISAVSLETEIYRYSKVSYILTVEDDPTAIENISAEKLNDGKIYDIQGRRVNKLGKGIYIINGKKIIIK